MANIDAILDKYGITYPKLDDDIPKGWLPDIELMFQHMIYLGWDKKLFQIKLKFGGLRVYVENSTNEINDLILAYEDKASTMCLECGSYVPINMARSIWAAPRCVEHNLSKTW